MKLYELNHGARIIVECSDGSSYITFNHIDGMYSHCTTEKGGVVHLSANSPLKKIDDYYVIDENQEI